MKPGETAHVTAQSSSLEGEGMALAGDREVFVHGLFPGESAEVRLLAVSKHHPRAHAELLRIEVPHPSRREAPCPNHVARGGGCTGCALMELDEAAQRALKASMLRERFGLPVSGVEEAPSPVGYRWSAKRVAFGRTGNLKLGSFTRGTHEPADMTGCLVDHPLLVEAFAQVAERASKARVIPHDEHKSTGDLRYVWAKTDGARVIVTLVVAQADGRAAQELAPSLEVDGVLVSVQRGRGNTLRGELPTLVRGVSELSTTLLGQTLDVGALGFLQPNPRVAEACYTALTEHAAGEFALDLYAGTGVTTRALRANFREVQACEAYAESAAVLGVAPETTEAFLARMLAEPRRVPELVIANPPRRGLGDEVCAALAELGAPSLRIMSCGPEGLARDLATLAKSGYTLTSLRAFDTLPQTPHVELVAVLSRLPHHA